MDKTEAIALLGGSVAAAAEKIGATYQAVSKWPAVLPPRISDRVQAALYRQMTEARKVARRKPADDAKAAA